VKGVIVKNAVLTQKLNIHKEPKLMFYRNGRPILYDGMVTYSLIVMDYRRIVKNYFIIVTTLET